MEGRAVTEWLFAPVPRVRVAWLRTAFYVLLASCMCLLSAHARYMSSSCTHQRRVASFSLGRSKAGSTTRATSIGADSITSLMPSLSKCSCNASRPTSSRA